MLLPDTSSVEQGGDAMRREWETSADWRSLRGQRFGYCRGRVDVANVGPAWAAAMAARTHPDDPVAPGDRDEGERSQDYHCAALMAWRASWAVGPAQWGPQAVRGTAAGAYRLTPSGSGKSVAGASLLLLAAACRHRRRCDRLSGCGRRCCPRHHATLRRPAFLRRGRAPSE